MTTPTYSQVLRKIWNLEDSQIIDTHQTAKLYRYLLLSTTPQSLEAPAFMFSEQLIRNSKTLVSMFWRLRGARITEATTWEEIVEQLRDKIISQRQTIPGTEARFNPRQTPTGQNPGEIRITLSGSRRAHFSGVSCSGRETINSNLVYGSIDDVSDWILSDAVDQGDDWDGDGYYQYDHSDSELTDTDDEEYEIEEAYYIDSQGNEHDLSYVNTRDELEEAINEIEQDIEDEEEENND